MPLGKKSFDTKALLENYQALISEIVRVKPATAKGKYIKSVAVSTTMGPGIKVDPTMVRNLLAE